MSDKMKNTLIGMFVITALIISTWLILFMEPRIGDEKQKIHVRFTNISGVNIGTRVLLAGVAVGEVDKIDQIKNARNQPIDELGRVYFYELTLKIDSKVEIYNTDEIAIQTTGLLGEKTIGIIPKAPHKDVSLQRITTQVVYGNSVEPIENALHQIAEVAEEATITIKDIDEWFVENKEELSFAVKAFGDAMHEVKNTLQGDLKNAISNVNKITDDIAEGKETIGKLIKEDDLYLRLVTIFSKVDTLMNDINHYGLLFQYDKGWQRIRTKRANLLTALNTPKEFKCYFETEVDGINASLARVNILLEKAEDSKQKEIILQSTPFKKDFAELLKKVEEILDSLKLYNRNITEALDKLE